MTAALWTIAFALLILAGVAAFAAWAYFVDDGDLEVLTEDDVAQLTRPYVDRLPIMAADDTPRPDGLRLTP
jgi:hypothetical protein